VGRASNERRHKRAAAGSVDEPPSRTITRAIIAVAALAVIGTAAWALWSSSRPDPAVPPGAARPSVYKDGSPAWSPDGAQIAFYSERDGNAEIYVMGADGSNITRLTNSPADEGYPAWSPDGRTLTFDSDRDGDFEIYAMDRDGSNVRQVTDHPARDVSAAWAPDGSHVVFMSDRAGGFDVYKEIVPAAAHPTQKDAVPVTVRLTTTGSSWFPAYSADGSRMAFHVGRDVHVMPARGGPLRRLTTDPANGMYPTWSPDATRIAFMSWRNGRTELFTMQSDGSDQKVLLSMPRGDAIDPRWSPDGRRIAFVHMPDGMNGKTAVIGVVETKTGRVTMLTSR
jgi:Tol biopolymer transport system component